MGFEVSVDALENLIGNVGGDGAVFGLFSFLLLGSPGIWIVVGRGYIEVFQQEISSTIAQPRPKGLAGILLLAYKGPWHDDAILRVFVVDPDPCHIRLDDDLVDVLVENLAVLGGLGFHIRVWGYFGSARRDARDKRNPKFVHEAGDLGEDFIICDVAVVVGALVFLEHLDGLAYFGKLLVYIQGQHLIP